MEDRLIIVDGINNNIEEAKDFQDFVDYVKEGIDPDEGFDMDITSIALFKRVGHVKIGDETGHFKPNKYGEQIPIRQVEYVNELSHPSDSDIESLAKFMHDEYERIAIEIGWDTQASCKVEFENLPKENKELMLLVAKSLRDRMNGETELLIEWMYENDVSPSSITGEMFVSHKNKIHYSSIPDLLQKFRNRDL